MERTLCGNRRLLVADIRASSRWRAVLQEIFLGSHICRTPTIGAATLSVTGKGGVGVSLSLSSVSFQAYPGLVHLPDWIAHHPLPVHLINTIDIRAIATTAIYHHHESITYTPSQLQTQRGEASPFTIVFMNASSMG